MLVTQTGKLGELIFWGAGRRKPNFCSGHKVEVTEHHPKRNFIRTDRYKMVTEKQSELKIQVADAQIMEARRLGGFTEQD